MNLAIISVIYYNGSSVPVPNDDMHGWIYFYHAQIYHLLYSYGGHLTRSYIVAQLPCLKPLYILTLYVSLKLFFVLFCFVLLYIWLWYSELVAGYFGSFHENDF